MLSKYRQISEPFEPVSEPEPLAPLAETREFERLDCGELPCHRCGPVNGILFWEDSYGQRHCANCRGPLDLVMVRRLLMMVPAGADDYEPLEMPEPLEWLVRPDYLQLWMDHERRRKRAIREREIAALEKEPDDEY